MGKLSSGLKAKVVGFISLPGQVREHESLLMRVQKDARWARDMERDYPDGYYKAVPRFCSIDRALYVLDIFEQDVDSWRASDGGLTHAACDSMGSIRWARRLVGELVAMSKSEVARICVKLGEDNYEEDNLPGYRTCYDRECYELLIAVCYYLVLR